MRRFSCIVVIAILGLAPVVQPRAEKLTGTFVGTGRACSGRLAIQAKTISWVTAFSRCESLPYDIIEQTIDAETFRYSFKFKRHPPGGRYRYLMVTQQGVGGAEIGWGIIDYGSDRSHLADKASGYMANAVDTMSCYLVREPR